MPLILERKERSNVRRVSGIPRPLTNLVFDNGTGISHASKPTVETLPIATPQGKYQLQKQKQQQISNNPNKDITHDTPKLRPLHPSQPSRSAFNGDNGMDHNVATSSGPEVSVLELVPFSRQPTVNFGTVSTGSTRIAYVVLRNSANLQQQLKVISFPKADKGFYIDATEFLIAPRTEINVGLAWTPKVVSGIRETITLHDVNRMRWRIVLTGSSVAPKPQLPFQNRSSRAQVPRLFRRTSPNKLDRRMISERNKLVFSPASRTKARQSKVVKPLTKLRTPSPSRKSQIVRKLLSKRDDEFATRIQSYFRMYLARQELERRKCSNRTVIHIQAQARGLLVRRQLRLREKAAVVIQSHWRALQARRELNRMRMYKQAVICLQAYVRGWLLRKELKHQKMAAMVIQSSWRTRIARKELKRLKMFKRAIILLQACVRGFLARRQLARNNEAAIVIQSGWRALKARRELEKRKIFKRAVTYLQAHVRGQLVRKELRQKKDAAVVIQSYWRALRARQELQRRKRFKRAVILLQALVRGHLARKEFKRRERAITVIQSNWRARKAREELERRKKFRLIVIRLQAQVRGQLVRRQLTRRKDAAIIIQKYCRSHLAKQELTRLKRFQSAVVWLQSQSRGYIVRKQFKRSVEAVFRIQLQSFRTSLSIVQAK